MHTIPWTSNALLTITPQKTNSLFINFYWEAVEANAACPAAQTSNLATHLIFIDQNRFPTI